jgi:hypothetical protein
VHQLPKRPTILPGRLRRFCDVPLIGKQKTLDVNFLELGDNLLSQQALAGDSMSLVTLDFNKQTVILR